MTNKSLPAEPNLATAPAEPLITIGAAGTIVAAVIALLVAFGAPITQNEQVAILGFVAAVAPVVTALVGRLKVYSPWSVARLLVNARQATLMPTTRSTSITSPTPPTTTGGGTFSSGGSATITPLNPPPTTGTGM